jgi:hypothetical protein
MADSGVHREFAPQASGGRQEARLASSFAVRVVWVDMSHACHGRLRDVSTGGARIVAEGGEKPRGDIYLLATLPGEAEPRRIGARLRWQVGETLGVRFEPAIALELVFALAGLDGPPAN